MDKKGYTIAEAVTSLILLLLVWVAVIEVVLISRSSESLARHKTQAVYRVHRKIEELQVTPYASITSSAA